MLKQHSPQKEESLLPTFQRQRETGRQQQSPHPPAAHTWLTSRPTQTASGQRRETTSTVTARKRQGGSRDRDWPQRPPWRASESYCRDRQRANSRDRSRQSDLRGAGSGQKTATGHTENTRVNKMKLLAVQRPPTTVEGKTAIETIHAHSVVDRLTGNGKLSDSVSNKTGHESYPTKSGLKAPSWIPKPKNEKPGRNSNGSGPPKTLPPHHLAGHAEMRRERQPRTEQASEDPPAPPPRRACRDEEGESTETELVAGVRRKRATPGPPAHE